MPKFRIQETVSIDLHKDIELRIMKDETHEEVVERAKRRLAVPRQVAKGYKLTDVTFDVSSLVENSLSGKWDCSVQATLVAVGEHIEDEKDAKTAQEVCEEGVFNLGSEVATMIFVFLDDEEGDMKDWSWDGEVDHIVNGVLPWRKVAPAEAPVPA